MVLSWSAEGTVKLAILTLGLVIALGVTVMNPNATRGGFAFAANDVFAVGDTGIVHYGN